MLNRYVWQLYLKSGGENTVSFFKGISKKSLVAHMLSGSEFFKGNTVRRPGS